MNFKNMSIRKSLILGFGITILVSVIIIVTSLVMMSSQKSAYKDILDGYVAANQMVSDCRIDYNIAARNLRDAVLSGDMSGLDNANSKITELASRLNELNKIYPASSDKSLLTSFINTVEEWEVEAKRIAEVARTSREDAVEMIISSCSPRLVAAATAGDKLADSLQADQDKIIDKQNTSSTIGIAVIIAVMVVATFVVLLMATKIIRSIVEPSNQVRNALVGFSQGNLAVPVDYVGKNELGDMCDALRTSKHVLGECISDTCSLLE